MQQLQRKVAIKRELASRIRDNLAVYQYNHFYDWQHKFCKNTKYYYESCLCAANQIGKCNSYNTLIETEFGSMKIGEIFGKKIKVKTHPDNKLKSVLGWVVKDPEECFRITLRDGSWVEVPLGHKILDGRNYLSVSEIFQDLPESVFCRPQSSSASSLLARVLGVERLFGRVGDLINSCLMDYRLYGVQPRHALDNGLIFAPSKTDVQQHISRLSRLGGLACKYTYSLFGKLPRLSNLGGVHRTLLQFFSRLSPLPSFGDQLLTYGNQESLLSRAEQCQEKPFLGSCCCKPSHLSSQPYYSESPSFAVNEIVSVYPVGVKRLYDMEVEDRHNYIAGGLVHHNTYIGTTLDAFHLTGDYPEGYEGHKFNFAPLCWGLGYSMEKTRDLLQTALFGNYNNQEFSGGLVPKDRILSWESASGTANAMRTVRVRHANGGTSTMQFWSYSQGQHAIMGDVVDWFHVDEEPRDQSIRPQVLTRTINGDKGKGGRGIYTFTPENGRTELVIKFMDDPSKDQVFMQKGWIDAPHITKEKRERMLEQYPTHQRDMRTKGIPMLGHGRIYDLSEEFITCEPFDIPDHWFVIGGMDFGWDHPQAHIQLVEDRDTGTFYLTKAYKASKISANDAWGAVKPWQKGIPVAWPHDGLQHEKGRDDAVQQKQHYKDAGFKMLREHATHPPYNKDGKSMGGGISVESGIYAIHDLMRKGQFKVFYGCRGFFEEFNQYHRDEKGLIVKTLDDILDAVRYAYMMRRFSIQKGDIMKTKKPFIMPPPLKQMGSQKC